MNGNKAKLKFNPNNFEVIEEGDYVVCAVSGKNIPLNQLTYWNVELQEAYFSPKEAQQKYEELNKTDNVSSDKEILTKRINEVIEKMILRNPGQWIWTHNRWK